MVIYSSTSTNVLISYTNVRILWRNSLARLLRRHVVLSTKEKHHQLYEYLSSFLVGCIFMHRKRPTGGGGGVVIRPRLQREARPQTFFSCHTQKTTIDSPGYMAICDNESSPREMIQNALSQTKIMDETKTPQTRYGALR